MTMVLETVARFFGKTVDAWLTVPRHFTELSQVRGSLKYGDRCVALTPGTEALWLAGRSDYDPDLWVMAPPSAPEEHVAPSVMAEPTDHLAARRSRP